MPAFGPIKRRDLIAALRAAGFTGPFAKRRHEVMIRGDVSVPIPNPHRGDIGKNLLAVILREAGISRDTWERL
jgi:hypothetical protein